MFTDEQILKISKNIKILMGFYKEKQYQLADSIGVLESTISNYIKGTSIPKRENLIKIAKHYNITEYELINVDLSENEIYSKKDSYDFIINIMKNFSIYFPIIENDSQNKDNYFKKAKNLNEKLWEDIENKEIQIADIVKLYLQSYDDSKDLDAYANAILLMLLIKTNDEAVEDYVDIYNPFDKKDLEIIYKESILKNFDEEFHNDDINDNQEDAIWKFIYQVLEILSANDEYKDFVYYFTCLKYMLGHGIDNKDKELVKLIGNEMFTNLYMLNNKYAIEIINKLEKIIE